ncbi:MAG: YidC/Oxa1 family membrane protein insertase [Candidatus Gracilibacteria bacterium]
MNKNSLFKNILLFLVVFLVLNFIFKSCQSSEKQASILDQGDIGFMTDDTSYSRNKDVTVEIKNNTATDFVIPQDCPAEPFDVFHYENGEWVQITSQPELDCSKAVSYTLKPGEEAKVPYDNWKHALFSRMGRFKISFTTQVASADGQTQEKTFVTNEFMVEEEGILTKLWNGVLYRPIYNTLIFLISIMPGHDLGLALILLTIIIRTILLAPSHKAMKAQRKMQEIQPKIEEIKQKYKGDQQKIAQETMLIWKTQKVNPLGSCLPLLLQFPVLIALFWVVQGGLNPDNTYLFYTTYGDFSFSSITTVFLGLDLLKINLYVLPLIIGLLQFGQMKLAMYQKGKKKDASGSVSGSASGAPKEMAMASNMMLYAMPVLIAIFTAQLPAAVGVYWGASTIYGIVQQIFVNRSFDKPENKSNSDDVAVRVIENKS